MKILKMMTLCAFLLLPLLTSCSEEITYTGIDLTTYSVTGAENLRINVRDSEKAYTLTGVVIEFDNEKMLEVFFAYLLAFAAHLVPKLVRTVGLRRFHIVQRQFLIAVHTAPPPIR